MMGRSDRRTSLCLTTRLKYGRPPINVFFTAVSIHTHTYTYIHLCTYTQTCTQNMHAVRIQGRCIQTVRNLHTYARLPALQIRKKVLSILREQRVVPSAISCRNTVTGLFKRRSTHCTLHTQENSHRTTLLISIVYVHKLVWARKVNV